MNAPRTPVKVHRIGTFLYQLDPASPVALWSGKLGANNGKIIDSVIGEEHALQAARLFEAAPEMLQALRDLMSHAVQCDPMRWHHANRNALEIIRRFDGDAS